MRCDIEFKMTSHLPSLIDFNLYEHLSHSSFDSKSRPNAEKLDLNEQILKISDAIEQLNSELNVLVSSNYKELIDRTRKINELEHKFDNVQKNILNLLAVLDKLKSILSEPYKEIAQRISLLNRLQTTCDLMRRIIRIFSLTKKLDAVESRNEQSHERTDLSNFNHKELIRKALFLNEVNQLLEEDQLLYQIEVIKNDLDKFKQEQSNLTQISSKIMDIGLSKQDITMLTNSLQIFCLFNNLEQVVKKFLDEKEQLIVETIKSTFNVKTNQVKIWIKIENLVEELAITINQVHFLHRVLKRRRDAMNQNYLIDTLNEPFDANQFYQLIFDNLNLYLKSAINDSQTIKQIIELEYPKLFKTFNEINSRLSLNEIEIEKQFKQFLRPYEAVYLSRSLSMLFDLVEGIFTINQYSQYNETFITNKDIDLLTKEISKQLLILDVDIELGKLISKNICQSINLFLVKCEQLIRVGADATQIVGSITESQKTNAKIVHKIVYFQQQMLACLPEKKLDNTDSIQLIKAKLNECNALILNIVTPFFDSIRDLTSDILITMHTEKYTPNSSDNSCSLYMKELHGFLLRIQSDYLKLFPNHEVLTSCLTSISISCIELFLRHATMVRQQKLPNVVKSKLSNDCDKLQQAVQLLGVKPSDLGKSYRILRAFKPMLKQDLNEIAKSAVIGNIVPYSMAIHYLIAAFSNDIELPHEMMSWSIPRYTKWCDSTNEQTKIEILRQCLENYVKKFGQRQELKQFPQVYCVILELLEAAKRLILS